MKLLPFALVITAMLAGLFSRRQKKEEIDWDQQVLDRLKRVGSSLFRPHEVEFFLYFPPEAAAREAAKGLQEEGCNVMVQPGENDKKWLCFATRLMVPEHAELVRLRKRFNEIAEKGDGEYDGWGTSVEN